MEEMKTLYLTAIFTLLGPVLGHATESTHEGVTGFSEICSLGPVIGSGSSCGIGIVLVGCEGDSLEISVGPSDFHPHTGLRVGSICSSGPNARSLPVGGPEEEAVIAKIWKHLVSVFGTVQEAREAEVGTEAKVSSERHRAAYLFRLVGRLESQAEARAWVCARFSAEDQIRISETQFEDLESDVEKEAFRKLCWMYGRGFMQRASELLNQESGLEEATGWCG